MVHPGGSSTVSPTRKTTVVLPKKKSVVSPVKTSQPKTTRPTPTVNKRSTPAQHPEPGSFQERKNRISGTGRNKISDRKGTAKARTGKAVPARDRSYKRSSGHPTGSSSFSSGRTNRGRRSVGRSSKSRKR